MPAKRKYLKKRGMKKTRAPRAPRVSESVKSYVKKTIHSQIENKSVQINPGPVAFGNVLESPDFNAYPMLPSAGYWSINQGTGAGSRIGNIIKTRKVMLNYVLFPLPYDSGTNVFPGPVEVRMMLGYVKNTPSFVPVAGDITFLFQAGNTSASPVGTLKDLISVYNTDYWSIKKSWTHKLGFSAYSGTSVTPNQQYYQNNDFKMNVVKSLDITKHCPKTCIFNDTAATTNTKNLFFMYYAVASNGNVLSNITLPVRIDYWIDYQYEDA
ncbi:MAG: putative capsid protein [Circoviridae sp.]|nr:MAG: putative capsid protein [Circoviridae sp.]